MTQESNLGIEANNRIIAEFMDRYKGSPIEECEHEIVVSRKESKWGAAEVVTRPFTYSDLKYNTSWDWLMPVIEKIEATSIIIKEDGNSCSVQFSVQIRDFQCTIDRSDYLGTEGDFLKLYDCRNTSKLQATYAAVTEFLTYLKG